MQHKSSIFLLKFVCIYSNIDYFSVEVGDGKSMGMKLCTDTGNKHADKIG